MASAGQGVAVNSQGKRLIEPAAGWLPPSKRAAVCFTIDDVHPGRSSDAYEAGGDLGLGALGHVEWLLKRHSKLQITLFVTADWREIRPAPSRRWLERIPWMRDHVFLTPVRPVGTMRLSRHAGFVDYVRSLPRTDCALHGLEHVNVGRQVAVEFAGRSAKECERRLREVITIFDEAGLPYSPGMCPPAWMLTPELAQAMCNVGLRWVASARDIRTPISLIAKNSMSGLTGASLVSPEVIEGGRMLHFTTNFQATSTLERAHQIVAISGLVAIKAHIVKEAFGFIMLDGLDAVYRDYLHRVFCELEDKYGDSLWWTSMNEIADKFQDQRSAQSPIKKTVDFREEAYC